MRTARFFPRRTLLFGDANQEFREAIDNFGLALCACRNLAAGSAGERIEVVLGPMSPRPCWHVTAPAVVTSRPCR